MQAMSALLDSKLNPLSVAVKQVGDELATFKEQVEQDIGVVKLRAKANETHIEQVQKDIARIDKSVKEIHEIRENMDTNWPEWFSEAGDLADNLGIELK